MIILVYPMLSASDLYADSNWVFLVALLKTIVRKKKDWFFYVIVPSGARVIEGELFNDNIIPITMEFPDRSRHRFCSHFDAKAMLRIYHDIPIDLVFNQVPEVGHLLSGSFREKMGRYNTPIINQHHYVMHPSHPNYLLLDYITISQIAGSLIADVNVYNSKYTEKMMIENADNYLNEDRTRAIYDSGVVIPMGTLPKKPRNVKKYDRFTFVYNHRIAKYKGTDDTFKMFDRLWKGRQDFDVVVAVADTADIKWISRRPYVRIEQHAEHANYFKLLAKCHANTFNTKYETFCIAMSESMLFGNVPIVPRNTTMPELVGDDYPYMFDSYEEQYAMLNLIIDLYPVSIAAEMQEHAAKLFNAELYANRYIKLLEKYRAPGGAIDAMLNPKKRDKLVKELSVHKELSYFDARRIVAANNFGSQSFEPRKTMAIMRELGYAVHAFPGEVVFNRG